MVFKFINGFYSNINDGLMVNWDPGVDTDSDINNYQIQIIQPKADVPTISVYQTIPETGVQGLGIGGIVMWLIIAQWGNLSNGYPHNTCNSSVIVITNNSSNRTDWGRVCP